MNWIGKTGTLVAKELRIERRMHAVMTPMAVFAAAAIVLLAFALPDAPRPGPPELVPPGTVISADVLAGFFWITILFAGLIGFARTFELERQDGALEALLLVPLDRTGLFAGKAVANLVYVVAVQALLAPVFALMFDIGLGARWAAFVVVMLLVDVGFVAAGTLFAAVAAGTRSRELMLPILALPALVPAFIAGTELTSDLFVGSSLAGVAGRGWFGILVAFDIIFAVVGALVFEYALD